MSFSSKSREQGRELSLARQEERKREREEEGRGKKRRRKAKELSLSSRFSCYFWCSPKVSVAMPSSYAFHNLKNKHANTS